MKLNIFVLQDPWKKFRARLALGLIFLGWIFFAMIVYQISLFDYEMANFDPYEILEVREFALNQIIYNQPVVPGEHFGGQEADQVYLALVKSDEKAVVSGQSLVP